MKNRIRLYNESTKRVEWFTVHRARMPWERMGVRMRLAFRNIINFYRLTLLPSRETGLCLNAETLKMRNPKEERRQRRRKRRTERFARIAEAVMAMVEMQKHLN